MIKAVIFDMDGVLIDSEPIWKQTVYKIYKTIGIELTDEQHTQMIGRRAIENLEHFYSLYPWEGPTIKEVEAIIAAEVINLIKSEGVLMPGVHHVLSICKKAGLPVAIASSSTSEIIDAVVETLEIREHFDHIYSAEFEPYGKPHPGVFLKVAENFKVPPASCLVFEDSPAGVLAAKAANMHCVAVPIPANKNNSFIRTADVIIDSLEEFEEALLDKL